MADNFHEEVVNITNIERDDYFRISRNFKNPDLAASLKNSGMLEKPFLIKRGSGYYPFTCHNRISLMSETDTTVLNAFILESPSCEIFTRNVLLKVYRNECGPLGRVKAMIVMRDDFRMTGAELSDFARKILKIPRDIFSDDKLIERIMQLPAALKDYIDLKDIPFKVVKDIAASGDESIIELNRWIENIQIRLNIFKMLVDFIFDIRRRDGKFKRIEDDLLAVMDDKALYEYVFRIRYPEYAMKKENAETLIGVLNRGGVSVEFPEFFERDQVSFRFTINKKESGNKLAELASGLDVKKIDELLSLL